MRGMSGFGHHPGMRQLPRPGATGGSLEFVSVPGLPGRRSRAGSGHGGTDARACVGRGVGTAVPCFVTVREMAGRTTSPCGCTALRPVARTSQAPLKGATGGVQPHRISGAAKRRCRRPADKSLGAPSRGACKAAAFSRDALHLRRASVVTSAKRTAMRSERASDDARTGNRLSTESVGTQRRFRISADAQSSTWSGAKWCQAVTRTFFRGNVYFNPVRSAYRRSIGLGGCFSSWRDGSFRRFMSRCEDSYGCLAGPER